METYKFRTLIHNEYGRDIPSSWFFVIADSKENAQGIALDYIKAVNEFNKRFSIFTTKTFYSGAIFEHVLPHGHLNTSAINFDQIKSSLSHLQS